MGDLIDKSTNTILGILVAVVLISSALIPVALDQINALKTKFASDTEMLEQVNTYTGLIEVVIVIVIICLIIGVIKTYTKNRSGESD